MIDPTKHREKSFACGEHTYSYAPTSRNEYAWLLLKFYT